MRKLTNNEAWVMAVLRLRHEYLDAAALCRLRGRRRKTYYYGTISWDVSFRYFNRMQNILMRLEEHSLLSRAGDKFGTASVPLPLESMRFKIYNESPPVHINSNCSFVTVDVSMKDELTDRLQQVAGVVTELAKGVVKAKLDAL